MRELMPREEIVVHIERYGRNGEHPEIHRAEVILEVDIRDHAVSFERHENHSEQRRQSQRQQDRNASFKKRGQRRQKQEPDRGKQGYLGERDRIEKQQEQQSRRRPPSISADEEAGEREWQKRARRC